MWKGRVSPAEVRKSLGNGSSPVLLDIRDKDDFEKGTVPGAVNAPGGGLASEIRKAIKDQSKPVVVFCSIGKSSVPVAKSLSGDGYAAFSMDGGFDQWVQEGFDIVKSDGDGEFRGGDPEYAQEKREEKREEQELELSVDKAQPGEEAGEFRGGDPEYAQEKREEKRAEALESGEEDDEGEEEEELDSDEIAELEEAEAEKEAEKSIVGESINTSSGELSPIDTWEDYRPRNLNGDPLDEMEPIKPIELTAEPRPGKNQHKPWSDVTGYKVPLQGEKWVHLRQYTMRGDEEGALREQAKLFRSLNHGLTFDPHFYIAKARKGEVIPGHKYVYRWMDESGVWQYEYSDGTHANHGPGHIGNMQGHTLEVPEGHVETHDPDKKDPKGAYQAAVDKVLHEGGVFPFSFNDQPKILRIHGHKGGKPKKYSVEMFDEAKVREEQKVPEGSPLDFKKHKLKASKLAKPEEGGGRFTSIKNLEGTIRRAQVHTEVDAEGKPFVKWRFAGEASEKGKGRKKEAVEGRNISLWYVDPEHPLAEELQAGSSKAGVQHSAFKDIGSLRKWLAKKKREHSQILGHVNLDSPHPELDGKPIINWIHKGGVKKKTEKRSYNAYGHWDPNHYGEGVGRWISEVPGEESQRYRKKRTVVVADLDDNDFNHVLDKLTGEPDTKTGKPAGELYPLIVHDANNAVDRINNKRAKLGQLPITKGDRRELVADLVTAGVSGVVEALNYYDPAHESKASFVTFARHKIVGQQAERARELMSERGAQMFAHGGAVSQQEEKQARDMISEAHEQGQFEDELSQYEDPNEWFDRAEKHLAGAVEHLSDENFEHGYDQIQKAEEGLAQLKNHFEVSQDPSAIISFIHAWNDPARGGNGFIPEFKEKDNVGLLDKLALIGRGGKHAEEALHHEFGKDRLDESLDELHSMMEGADQVGQEDYGDTEHSKVSLSDPDLRKYIQDRGVNTVRDLISHTNKTPVLGVRGVPSRRAADNIARFTNWLKNDPNLDVDYGLPPFRAGGATEEERAIPSEEKAPVAGEAAPGIGKRTKKSIEEAVSILRKAEEQPKLFQPVPEGVEVEENQEYDPDPSSGKNWANRYQDPETGSTRYSYLHQDRVNNPKLHHNNLMRYLDAQLPKIRSWYKEMISSDQPMDRAVGLFVMLMDQAKVRHHDEIEGGLSTLKVGQVEANEGDVVSLKLGDQYTVKMTMDQHSKAVLQELMEGKNPEDNVFSVDGRDIDPEIVEQFLSNTFNVDANSFRVLHSTKQYSKEFQKLADEGHQNLDHAKEQALENTAIGLGHHDGANAVRDHVDPVADEALHMMSGMKKSLFKGYRLQGKIEFQGFPISIENKRGSTRKWYDPHGKESGETKMHFDYGYIRRTKGTDGDHVDVYVGPNDDADTVYVVHQMKKPDFKKYDEDKCMMGFGTAKEAKDAYMKQYDDPRFFGSMTPISVEEFRAKVMGKENQGKMIKSHVWHVSVDHPDRTDEEELFGQWLHDYPIHEHENRWAKQKEIDQQEKPQKPSHGLDSGVEVKTHDVAGDEAGAV